MKQLDQEKSKYHIPVLHYFLTVKRKNAQNLGKNYTEQKFGVSAREDSSYFRLE